MPALSNPKHEAFCQAYVKGETAGNATGSYKRAGFKGDRRKASRTLQREDVRGRIAEIVARLGDIEEKATAKAIEKLGIDKEWVLSRLITNVERAMQAEAVVIEGVQTGEYRYEGNVANKALELLGKHVGMFNPPPVAPQSLNVSLKAELVDRPPRETFKQWEARRAAELAGKHTPRKPEKRK